MELNHLKAATPTSAYNVFPQNIKNWKTYFFELLLGNLSDLCETWHVHSSAGPDLKMLLCQKMYKLLNAINTTSLVAMKLGRDEQNLTNFGH